MSSKSPNDGRSDSDRSNSCRQQTPSEGQLVSFEEGATDCFGAPGQETEAVKTFEFEVSAGHSPEDTAFTFPIRSTRLSPRRAARPAAGHSVEMREQVSIRQANEVSTPRIVGEARRSLDRALVMPASSPQALPNETHQTARRVIDHGKQQPGHASESVELSRRATISRYTKAPSHRQLRSRLFGRHSAWWIVSLGLHAVVLLVLAFSTLVVLREPEQLDLYASPVLYETVDEATDLEIDPSDALEPRADEMVEKLDDPTELIDAELATLADISSESPFDQQALGVSSISETAVEQLAGSFGEMGQLFGENGNGMSDMGIGDGESMATFFGTEVKARRILYMLDNSGGMLQGGKFESLVSELQSSIGVLGAKQQFYVIFFSDTVYPLFYPQSVRRFMSATAKNRQQLEHWLESVELCTGNAIDEALAAAEVIRPDAVFLLTDGNLFTTAKKKSLLLNRAGRRYPIFTFGLGVGEHTKTAEGLQRIAEANGGTFRALKVSDASKEIASEKNRPYHNKTPGLVWGLRVGVRK